MAVFQRARLQLSASVVDRAPHRARRVGEIDVAVLDEIAELGLDDAGDLVDLAADEIERRGIAGPRSRSAASREPRAAGRRESRPPTADRRRRRRRAPWMGESRRCCRCRCRWPSPRRARRSSVQTSSRESAAWTEIRSPRRTARRSPKTTTSSSLAVVVVTGAAARPRCLKADALGTAAVLPRWLSVGKYVPSRSRPRQTRTRITSAPWTRGWRPVPHQARPCSPARGRRRRRSRGDQLVRPRRCRSARPRPARSRGRDARRGALAAPARARYARASASRRVRTPREPARHLGTEACGEQRGRVSSRGMARCSVGPVQDEIVHRG